MAELSKMADLRIVPPDEHAKWCKAQIKEKGLIAAVQAQLDEIMLDCSQPLGDAEHDDVIQRCQNVTDLLVAFGKKFGIVKPQ